jgi:hypothetical protein
MLLFRHRFEIMDITKYSSNYYSYSLAKFMLNTKISIKSVLNLYMNMEESKEGRFSESRFCLQ